VKSLGHYKYDYRSSLENQPIELTMNAIALLDLTQFSVYNKTIHLVWINMCCVWIKDSKD